MRVAALAVLALLSACLDMIGYGRSPLRHLLTRNITPGRPLWDRLGTLATLPTGAPVARRLLSALVAISILLLSGCQFNGVSLSGGLDEVMDRGVIVPVYVVRTWMPE